MTGIDPRLFVLALLFLVGFNRCRLLWMITAFTAAHSITLALSALVWLTLLAAGRGADRAVDRARRGGSAA